MEKKSEALSMTELDKFKRRMIRSVAGMLIHQKMPEEHVWDEMRTIMGYDCKILWDRMKSLTVKKLKRLLAADDRTECIPAVARMTLTDWQLYDQILVHEDVDVIGLDTMSANKADSKVLIDLFSLVQRFEIEMTLGDTLTEAWTDATLYYNSKGHQCSPMLLQKRWHQLKSETRRRFYYYWNNYRGSKRLVPNAEPFKPTILQRAIAKRYPEVITHKFPDWESSIKESLVILPDDFQRIKWNKSKRNKPRKSENTPDIVVVEPVIETIDLLHESDSEQDANQAKYVEIDKESDAVTRVKIKVEPEEPVIDYSSIAEKPSKTSMVIAQMQEEESVFDNINEDINDLKAAENNLIHLAVDYESKLRHVDNDVEMQDNENFSDNIPKITNVFGNAPMTDETLCIIENLAKKNTVTASKETHNALMTQTGTHNASTIDVDDSNDESDNGVIKTSITTNTESIETHIDNDDDVIVTGVESKENTTVSNLSHLNQGNIDLSSFGEIPDNLNFADDGIEFLDSGVEYAQETKVKVEIGVEYAEETKVEVETDEFDTKIQIKVENIDQATNSKDSHSEPQEFKLDEKLFLDPVVYTQKLDDMCVLKNKEFESINDKLLINKIVDESKPISDRSVDAEKTRIDRQRVSVTSYLFKKPKHRNYNPIQLCKNPDFNTRLKRLTAGFLSSSQNRGYLKACMPLTIDLTKAFEPKLIDNTVYLKKPDNSKIIKIEDDEAKTVSMIPSANPIQSIIDNTPSTDDLKYTNQSDSQPQIQKPTTSKADNNMGRYKTIHLPDIIQIRRINQTLLTAEISPMPIRRPKSARQSQDAHSRDTPIQSDFFSEIRLENNDDTTLHQSGNCVNTKNYINSNTSDITPGNSKRTDGVIDISDNASNPNLLQTPKNIPIECLQNAGNNLMQSLSNEIQRKRKQQSRVPWRPMYTTSQQQLMWNKKITTTDINIDEFLITRDTLDKMLCLFNGEVRDDSQKKKQNKRGRPIVRTDTVENKNVKTDEPKISQDEPPKLIPIIRRNMSKLLQAARKKKEQAVESIAHRTPNLVTRVHSKDNTPNKKFCCWARERLFSGQTFSKKSGTVHPCGNERCTCCCNALLQAYIRREQLKKSKETKEVEVQTIDEESEVESTVAVAQEKVIAENITDVDVEVDNSKTDVPCEDMNDDILAATNVTINRDTEPNPPEVIVSSSPVEDIVCTDVDVAETVVADNVLTQLPPLKDISVPTISGVYSLNSKVKQIPLVNNPNIAFPTTPSVTVGSSDPVANIIVTINKPAALVPENKIIQDSMCKRRKPYPKNIKDIGSKLPEKQISSDMISVKSGPNNKGRILVLNEDKKSVPISCPVYLGQNKILLTNIKFPEHITKDSQSLLKAENQKPTQQIPKGVQLLLLANGKLNYLATPGFQFSTETTVVKPPKLLSTIQQPLGSSTNKSSTDISTADREVVDISDDETTFSVEELSPTNGPLYSAKNTSSSNEVTYNNMFKKSNDTKLNENLTSEEILLNKQEVVAEGCGNINENMDIEVSANDMNLSGKDNSANVEVSTSKHAEKLDENNKNPPIAKKTILSDLMEMSGISAEDAVPVQVESKQNDVAPVPNLNISVPSIPTVSNTNISVSPTLVHKPDNPVQLLHELSTVTSFTELRYACEQGGLFFKLDFETGVVSPIQVTFKRGPRPTNVTKNVRIAPKLTIDLTDDVDNDAPNSDTISSKEKKIEKAAPQPVKPITLLKGVQRPRILRTLRRESRIQSFNTSLLQTQHNNLGNIISRGKKILEFTVRAKRNSVQEIEVLSESSDEEPLSVKAKRKRLEEHSDRNTNQIDVNKEKDSTASNEGDKNSESNISVEQGNQLEHTNSGQDLSLQYTETGDRELLEHAETIQDGNNTSQVTPIPGSLVMADEDVSMPRASPIQPYQYEPNPNDETEDCILGV